MLRRSGIGRVDVLQRNDVNQIVDLPGVGENCMGKIQLSKFIKYTWKLHRTFQDHYWISLPYVASDDAETLDVVFRGETAELERMLLLHAAYTRLSLQRSSYLSVACKRKGTHGAKVRLLSNCRSIVVTQRFFPCSGVDAGIKIRPNSQDLKEIGPAFDARWKTYFADALDKPVAWIGTLAG